MGPDAGTWRRARRAAAPRAWGRSGGVLVVVRATRALAEKSVRRPRKMAASTFNRRWCCPCTRVRSPPAFGAAMVAGSRVWFSRVVVPERSFGASAASHETHNMFAGTVQPVRLPKTKPPVGPVTSVNTKPFEEHPR